MNETTSPEQIPSDVGMTADKFVEKLRRALRQDGDFPASAKVVSELKRMVSDPDTTANNIAELILREPSLGTRVLHLVNSAFYARAKPIMTVSHAVVQIGMRPLAELCAGLVLLQKFIPAARHGGAFAQCLQKTITTSLLTSSISSTITTTPTASKNETGYLAGTFIELGTLLLAYYFPQLYEAAIKRSKSKNQPIGQSIQELCGLNPIELSIEVIDALGLPAFYKEVLEACQDPQGETADNIQKKDHKDLSQALFAAQNISEVITNNGSKEELDAVLAKIDSTVDISPEVLSPAIGDLQQEFREHCSSLELNLTNLPEFIESYAPDDVVKEEVVEEATTSKKEDDQFQHFVDEIREAVDNREPTAAVITTVMETFAWSLSFDRVLLLLVAQNKQKLVGRMTLGQVNNLDPKNIARALDESAGPYAPDVTAFRESRPVFSGDPIFEDGWPFAVIPIGFGKRVIGIIYADRIDSGQDELLSKEQAAIGVLAELLDRSISVNS